MRSLLTISLVFMLLLSLNGKAQPNYKSEVDSIRQELPKLEGRELIQAYYEIYNLCYYAGDVKQERKAIDDLLAEAERQGDVKKQTTARAALLYYYYNTDKDDSLLAEFPKQQAFMLKQKDWKLYYDIWVLIVNHYTFTSQSNTALREVKRMYDDAQQRENKYGIGLASYGMGNAYMEIGFHEEAIQAYERCIKVLEHSAMGSSTLLDVYPYYCSVLSEVKNYRRMLEITDLWLAYLNSHKKELGLDNGKATGSSYYTYYYNSRATALMGLGRLSEAEELMMKAYAATKEMKDNSQLTVFYNLGMLYMRKGDYQKALDFNSRLMDNYVEPNDPSGTLMLKKQRAEIMLQSHQYEEAANLYKQVYYLADSLYINDAKNQLNEFNTLFKVDEMERENQQVKTRHVYIVLGVIIIALLLIGLLGLYFMNRLRQKNHELAVALDHAKESDRMKTSFIQHVSHEIRTPLNIISGFSQVIGNPDYHLSGDERQNIVNSIEQNTREITNFINELLVFSEIDSHNHYEETESVNINLFCQDLLKRAEEVNNGRLQLVFESQLDDHLTVISNTKALEGILRPLLSNAMKFTEKGNIKLQVKESEEPGMLDICVTDTGIGIAEDQRDRIFEKFYKVDSFKHGLGLGLPMARSIAHKIKGDLMLDDNYKEGTRFILRIPNKS
ncbi:MAG: tetratricopeptide repeat-containing sensor histidine kinase [Prevotella sp.]|nr:tetratricopeptide repeat-containing sensor histidine kinase [Prevotella sp.]MBQ8715975.1 tetratricopeptide repeat-containing sensor histidine kinase [Prevotella sp.]